MQRKALDGRLFLVVMKLGHTREDTFWSENHLRNKRYQAAKKKNTTEMTPFMVKNAALSFDRS